MLLPGFGTEGEQTRPNCTFEKTLFLDSISSIGDLDLRTDVFFLPPAFRLREVFFAASPPAFLIAFFGGRGALLRWHLTFLQQAPKKCAPNSDGTKVRKRMPPLL